MKYKNGLIFICLIICLFIIASVSAADANDTNIEGCNATLEEIIVSEANVNDNSDAIASDEENSQDNLASAENDIQSGYTFSELQRLVDLVHEGDEIKLTNNFSLVNGEDSIKISKNITIDGDNHTLDGSHVKRILSLEADGISVILKNIKFINGGVRNEGSTNINDEGGAIFNNHNSSKLTIINCDFQNNGAYKFGGAIYSEGNLNITNSRFTNNIAIFGKGGAIYSNGTLFINNTYFYKNEVQKNYGLTDSELRNKVYCFFKYRYYWDGEGVSGFTKEVERIIDNILEKLNIPNLSKIPPITGGAIYSEGQCTIHNSNFTSNRVGADILQIATSGGAIHCRGDLFVYNTTFDSNKANDWGGGAIFAENNCFIYTSKFNNNNANKGCAIYCWKETHIDNSTFSNNQHIYGTSWIEAVKLVKAIKNSIGAFQLDKKFNINWDELLRFPTDGGAIWSKDCYIDSCKFDGNIAFENAGAIYTKRDLTITGQNNIFINNKAIGGKIDISSRYGGAIYCNGNALIYNAIFQNNIACSRGGAIYTKGSAMIYNSKFDGNHLLVIKPIPDPPVIAFFKKYFGLPIETPSDEQKKIYKEVYGGAIYADNIITVDNCSFDNSNSEVNSGGAIYSNGKITIKYSNFNNNWAPRGGAVWGRTTITLINSTFTGNQATEGTGGAIFMDSADTTLKIDGCVFERNTAAHDGGACYSPGESSINNSRFKSNQALGKTEEESLGGAIRAKKSILVEHSYFEDNYAVHKGGAIYADESITISATTFKICHSKVGGAIYAKTMSDFKTSTFTGNRATDDSGGAVYINELCNPKFESCTFEQNTCKYNGGAIYLNAKASDYLLTASDSTFKDNSAGNNGGAIFTNYETGRFYYSTTLITNCHFEQNSAKEGGAVYTSKIHNIYQSEFIRNKATGGDGGAIYINNKNCNPESNSCKFEQNTCTGRGGGIYLDSSSSELKLSGCAFTENSAHEGGAVYAHIVKQVSNSNFTKNTATNGAGGAVYINNKCQPEFASCRFEENSCTKSGGGIYMDSKNAKLKLTDSTFSGNHARANGGATYVDCNAFEFSTTVIKNSVFGGNTAQKGGAVYTGGIEGIVSNSVFYWNKATYGDGSTDGDGGAIYINNRGSVEFISCRLEHNNAYNRGGAIYMDSGSATFKASYCTFVGNHADNRKYDGARGGGNSVFNSGQYESIDMCWFGKNNPNFIWEFLKWNWDKKDTEFKKCGNVNIYMTLNETNIYKNTTYKVTIHFDKTLSKDLLHSTGMFWGDANFTNLKLGDRNEITADVVFTSSGSHVIYGKLDDQEVSLKVNTKVKGPSEVHILSCDDIKYPNQLKVTYEILNMSDITSFVIKDLQGEIVKQGPLTGPDTLLVDGLKPGCYTITIINHDSGPYFASSANATFNVTRGDLDLMVVVFNETYPDEIEGIAHAVEDGKYVLAVGTGSWNITVKNHVAHFNIGVLDAGNYTATISFAGDDLYGPCSNSTTFTVAREGTSFEIKVVPSEITYGGSVKVIPIFGDGVNGTVIYHLHNGTFIAELPAGENLTLPVLDVGSYVIIANYSGDRDHEPAFDSAHITVIKAQPEFRLEANPIIYGDNATVTHMLPGAATGTITYYWGNDTFLNELPVGENLTLPVLDAGTYVIIARYSGDKNLLNATANATLVVSKAETGIIALPVITTYKDDDYLLIELKDNKGMPMAGVNVTVDLNGAKDYTTDENGSVKIYTSNMGANTYDVYVSFNGTSNYLNSSAFTNIFVNTRPSQMTTTPLTTIYQVHKYLVVNLKDSSGNPIANANTFIVIHGVTYNCTTDDNGDARLIIRLDPNEYVATAVFDNGNYTVSLKQVKVTVYKANPKIIAKNKKFKANKKVKKYTITLKDNIGKAIKNAKVILKIKGKTYKAKTNSQGKATFKIKKLTKKGKFKATVTYEGNIRFNKATQKIKIIIK